MKTFVTKPSLPPLKEYIPYLEDIWTSGILSNCGNHHQHLERELSEYLKVENLSLVSNGTLALMVALKALNIHNSEIITTPYSFVATANSIIWTNNTPVFVDIEQDSPNIDPLKIQEAITDKTSAILAVHCYGIPCNVEAIGKIATENKLKTIYDAAHCFAVEHNGKSILSYGDISILSFHATKVFNTFEGGAIVSSTAELKEKVNRLKNFGFENELIVNEAGINCKMNEVSAAFGRLQLKYIDQNIAQRKEINDYYTSQLSSLDGVTILKYSPKHNYSYFPIILNSHAKVSRNELYNELMIHEIFSRRYFSPLITDFKAFQQYNKNDTPNARNKADNVLCLPIYPELGIEIAETICNLIQLKLGQ